MFRSFSWRQTAEAAVGATRAGAAYGRLGGVARGGCAVMLSAVLAVAISRAQQPPPSNASLAQKPSDAGVHPVLAILRDQEAAWNDGDVERFMQHYWKSDRLTFSSGGKVTRGWKNTLANYRRRYPTAERMGKTHFKNLEVFPLGETAALVLGEWFLQRQPDPLHGNFSVVFQKIDGRWVIIHDHTSRAADEKQGDAT